MSEILKPLVTNWEWQLQGACREVGPDIFFSPDGERGPAKTARENQAKAICSGCPVLAQCRSHALSAGETYGTWGGLSEGDREVIFTRRRRLSKRSKDSS